jgi:hypothetical protein
MKIKAIIHPAEEGGYWAEVPALAWEHVILFRRKKDVLK